MNQPIVSKLDFTRIKKSIELSLQNKIISSKETDSLLNELNSAKLVEAFEIPPDIVTMNSVVRLKFLNHDKQIEFQIVYPDEADSDNNKISILSPVATAIIGYSVGDEIEWIVPAGPTKIKIEKIIYQPEFAGDFQL